MRRVLIAATATSILAHAAWAQPTAAPDGAEEAIGRMRDDMIDAFNKGDVDRLLSNVTDDVTVTWQNAEVTHGTAELRSYYAKMMTGPQRVVKSVAAAPAVEGRHSHEGWTVSWGRMNDRFDLMDGRELTMDSRFTAVLLRVDGEWKVHAFHLSTDAFGGAILKTAVGTTARWVGLGAGGGGLVLGLIGGGVWGRRRRAATS